MREARGRREKARESRMREIREEVRLERMR
jgi:hypothetical protein